MRQQLRVGDVAFSVQTEGSGAPLVFVHGWSMSGRFFRRQVEAFPGHRVIVPDLRGHGESDKTLDGHTVAAYAADLHGILGELGVTRPVMVGWSMGAMVSYEYLRSFGPDSLAGIVIVDQPPSDFAWDGYEFGAFTLDTLREMNEQLQTDQAGLVAEFTQLMLHKADEAAQEWMAAEILRVPPVIASTILMDQSLRDYREFLPQIEVPALVLFGEDDKLTSPRAGEYIAGQIPGARLRTFPQSSHCPFWEEPDDFNAAVAEFVAGLA
jgi:pimeloyl-ACP methyl ester carboxylesterase